MFKIKENRVLVKVEEKEKQVSSIIIASVYDAHQVDNIGVIVDKADNVIDVEKGDRIVFDHLKAVVVELAGEKFSLVKIEDVFAVLG